MGHSGLSTEWVPFSQTCVLESTQHVGAGEAVSCHSDWGGVEALKGSCLSLWLWESEIPVLSCLQEPTRGISAEPLGVDLQHWSSYQGRSVSHHCREPCEDRSKRKWKLLSLRAIQWRGPGKGGWGTRYRNDCGATVLVTAPIL